MSKVSQRPKQYAQGWTEFYKLRFKVTPDVLIPRPETELLVDEILERVKNSEFRVQNEKQSTLDTLHSALTILDLGTGSGNIAISLAKNLLHIGGATIIAADISAKALEVAKQNAKLHGVEDQITFLQSNLLSCVYLPGGQCVHLPDIIVTNLPYIPSARIPYLDSSVKDFEPHMALDGGEDGFELYRKLFQQINLLSTPGMNLNVHTGCVYWKPQLVICEIDYTHGELAVTEAQKFFPEAKVEIKTDLAHKQRILLIWQLLQNGSY